jgi:hypothetical protein
VIVSPSLCWQTRSRLGKRSSLRAQPSGCIPAFSDPPDRAQAPVAQLDRALPSEGRGREFESRRVRQFNQRHRARYSVHGTRGPAVAPACGRARLCDTMAGKRISWAEADVLSRNLEKSLHRALAYANERRHEYATLEHLLLG